MSSTDGSTELDWDSLTPGQIFNIIVGYIQMVLLGVSVVCAIITIVTFTAFPRIRTYPIKLILFLCVTIVCGYTTFLFNGYFADIPLLCPIIGAIVHYFFLSNFFWCANIAFNFYEMVCHHHVL
mgnify:CR=1 FL=1